MNNSRNQIIIGGVIILILLGIYFTFDRKSDVGNNNEPVATTTSNGDGTISGNDAGYTIEQVPVGEGQGLPQPIPNLDRTVTVHSLAVITPQATAAATASIKDMQAILKNNPADFQTWLNLGIYQKMAGDYDGSVISWTYASKLVPNDSISLGNLGNLYAYFLKDNGKAETYYKQAIAKNPTQVNLYVQLADVYVNIFNDKTKALVLINEGLSRVPNDPSLLQIKASLE